MQTPPQNSLYLGGYRRSGSTPDALTCAPAASPRLHVPRPQARAHMCHGRQPALTCAATASPRSPVPGPPLYSLALPAQCQVICSTTYATCSCGSEGMPAIHHHHDRRDNPASMQDERARKKSEHLFPMLLQRAFDSTCWSPPLCRPHLFDVPQCCF